MRFVFFSSKIAKRKKKREREELREMMIQTICTHIYDMIENGPKSRGNLLYVNLKF